MNRRNFLKMATAAGLAGMTPFISGQAAAEPERFLHTGPVLMTLFMSGGYDDTSFSNPIGNPIINRPFTSEQVGKAGNLRYAPIANNKAFFDKYHQDILSINGIDIESDSHSITATYRITGHQENRKNPSLNELYAAIAAPKIPMPYMVQYKREGRHLGLMPPVEIPGKRLLRTFADINRDSFQAPSHMTILRRYQNENLQALRQQNNNLPRWRNKLNELNTARTGATGLKNILEYLDAPIDTVDLTGKSRSTIKGYNMFLIAAAAGFTATGFFGLEHNYDTHKDSDVSHNNYLIPELSHDIDYIWEKATQLGVADRLIIHVISDVGRSPYNTGGRPTGKDHWYTSSDIVMAKNVPWTNRIVGANDYQQEHLKLNPDTLKVDAKGVTFQTRHVHDALRGLLGIKNHPLAKKYPVYANETFDIFNGGLSTGLPDYLT